jgi:hypothetical protein
MESCAMKRRCRAVIARRISAMLLPVMFLTSNGFAQEPNAEAFSLRALQLTTADRSAPAGISHS